MCCQHTSDAGVAPRAGTHTGPSPNRIPVATISGPLVTSRRRPSGHGSGAAGQHLFDMGRLRILSQRAGVKSIDLLDDRLQIRFHDRPPVEPSRVLEIVARERGSLKPTGVVLLPAPPRGTDRIEAVGALLRSML